LTSQVDGSGKDYGRPFDRQAECTLPPLKFFFFLTFIHNGEGRGARSPVFLGGFPPDPGFRKRGLNSFCGAPQVDGIFMKMVGFMLLWVEGCSPPSSTPAFFDGLPLFICSCPSLLFLPADRPFSRPHPSSAPTTPSGLGPLCLSEHLLVLGGVVSSRQFRGDLCAEPFLLFFVFSFTNLPLPSTFVVF